jgi:hypothetical protein
MQTNKEKRDLLNGLRFCLKALEPPDAMTFVQQGEDATQEAKEKLRREIAYLEAVLAIGNPVGRVLDR